MRPCFCASTLGSVGGDKMKKIKGLSGLEAWEKPSARDKRKHNAQEVIQEAFHGESGVTVIPPQPQKEHGSGYKKLVAAYCRVSTEEENQISSYELQIHYYRERIRCNPNWEFAGVYADRGLSGTAMKKRDGLLQLMQACREGKVEHIITKSVSRFSRNVRDCLVLIDELLSLSPPVEVDFEVDGLNSARDRFESDLFMSSFIAQSESVKKSAVIKWAWQIRFSKGLALMPTHSILGYDKNRDGKIVVVPKEAKVIRYIYSSYLEGMPKGEIAKSLTESGIPTVKGLHRWSTSAVHNILASEKYVGDALMQKTYTPDCLSHKSVKNTGQLARYYKKNHHTPIIARSDWEKVQVLLESRKFERMRKGNPEKKILFKPVTRGPFKGFFVVPKRCSGRALAIFLETIENQKTERENENGNQF